MARTRQRQYQKQMTQRISKTEIRSSLGSLDRTHTPYNYWLRTPYDRLEIRIAECKTERKPEGRMVRKVNRIRFSRWIPPVLVWRLRQESPCNEPSGVTFTPPKSVLDELIPSPPVTTNMCREINSLHEWMLRSRTPRGGFFIVDKYL